MQWVVVLLIYDLTIGQSTRGMGYRYVQLAEMSILFVILAPEFINYFFKARKKDIVINSVIVIYLITMYISAYVNRNMHNITNSYYNAIIYIVIFVELFLATKYLFKDRDTWKVSYQALATIAILYCICNDVDLLINYSYDLSNKIFLLGNKFDVAYAHIQALALYLLLVSSKGEINKVVSSILICFSALIIYLVDCTTGIVGLVIFLVLFSILYKKRVNLLWLWLVSIIYSAAFAFYYMIILNYQVIQNIIVNVFHRQLTLTGRTAIYKNIPFVLKDHVLLGYGYGSDYEVWTNFMRMPNSQNGIVEFLVEQGIIATALFILLVILIIKKSEKNYGNGVRIFVSVIVMYTFLASIEITLSLKFILFLFLLNAYVDLKEIIGKDNNFVKDN